jgi:serine phosphatase RsbU (regulator of sigma subunit)/type II secretory pathway pseudopilin PulG
MIFNHRHSLGTQLNSLIGLVLLILAVLYSSIFYVLEQQRQAEMLSKTELLLRVLVEQRIEDLANDLFGHYQDSMQLTLQQMKSIDNLLKISTYSPDGRLFASTNQQEHDLFNSDTAKKWQEPLPLINIQTWQNYTVLRYLQPLDVIGERVGYVEIFYDLTLLQQQQNLSITFLIGLFIALTLTLSLLVNRALNKWVLMPLNQLRSAMQILANNQPVEVIQLKTNAELKDMSDSFNIMMAAVIHTRRLIERRVEERTAQLGQANHEIRLLNEQLHLENRRLGSELAVSRRLQSMLLPTDQELSNINTLTITGMMTPSQEVGGDYYDVFQTKDYLICGIGDVTGHGLESGVLAMMTQTAVKALFSRDDLSLMECLIAVNKTIFSNVQRLSTDRTLSLLLLAYDTKQHQLTFTGQHESVLWVKEGELICLDTIDLGFPVGLEEDISDFVNIYQCQLNPNDVIVLYTDGITEAENEQHEYYGLERLMTVVKENWHYSPLSLKQAILNDVWAFIGNHTLLDDITLLILKRV